MPNWVTIRGFAAATGYSEKQIQSNIRRGFWKAGRGKAKFKAVLLIVDGETMINCEAFDRWVEKDTRRAASKKAWSQANAGKVVSYTRARQAAQLQRTPAWADLEAIEAVYAEAARISSATGEKHHVDHIVPLRGKEVSGLHVPWNLRVVPARENQRKYNKYVPDA